MQSPLRRYMLLTRRWVWLLVLGVGICGGGTYLFDKLLPPLYQASAELVISLDTSSSSDVIGSIAVVPTYAQLLSNAIVLDPVVAKHPGMTLEQLTGMITVKPQSNTQIIELDVQNRSSRLAMELANEISQSFTQYANSRLAGTVQILPAQQPTNPIKPKPLQDAGIASLIGLALAIALIIIFEWVEDRLKLPEQAQDLLGTEILASIPRVSMDKLSLEATPGEKFRMLCNSLTIKCENGSLKLIMVTSALPSEGKTTIAAKVAITLAKSGKRVLLVDANMHHPSLARHFQLHEQPGLTDLFLDSGGRFSTKLCGQITTIPNLCVLPAGRTVANPAELLQSTLARQLISSFKMVPCDYIIFDTPALLPMADAQIMLPLVDGVVLVVDASKTPRRVLSRARHILNGTRLKIVGVTLNKSRWSDCGGREADMAVGEQADYILSQQAQPDSQQPTAASPATQPQYPVIHSALTLPSTVRQKTSSDGTNHQPPGNQ